MTGDVTLNPSAALLIMTTEIYRNMLLCHDPCVEEISYVIFDEIHYITDIERGTIWEESLIFSPKTIRFLCLSATIPNAREFADWIESIKGHTVRVVTNEHRVVPLKHLLFDSYLGITDVQALTRHIKEVEHIPEYPAHDHHKKKEKWKRKDWKFPYHVELIKDLKEQDMLPCIFFVFSRKATQEKAIEVAKTCSFIDKKDMGRIISLYNSYVTPEVRQLDSAQLLRHLVQKGIAFHHAGMLPRLKELVEELFGLGLIKVLYATETFAVGINMPAKTVCFHSLEKYDGISFRYIHSKEYFQLAGRAGRRGIDTEGYAVALFNRNKDDIEKVKKLTEKDVEPILSRFTLSYNTVISLLKQHSQQEIEVILKQSFDHYLRKKLQVDVRIMTSFTYKVKILKKMGYVAPDNTLTEKGDFARLIYTQELAVVELCTAKFIHDIDDVAFLTALATLLWESRRGVKFYKRCDKRATEHLLQALHSDPFLFKQINISALKGLHPIIAHWYHNGDFLEMMRFTNLLEGDYIRLFRQLLDMLKQIKRATWDYDLIDRVERCMQRIDRDMVKVEL
jgi:superfamily II RNA helicase